MVSCLYMVDHDNDEFAQGEHILPETFGEWEMENMIQPEGLTPEEADEFFMQDDVGVQINAIIKESRGGIEFDNVGKMRAQKHYQK